MAFEDLPHESRSGQAASSGLNLDLRYWFWVFRRRFWVFAVVAGLLGGAGIGLAMVLPPTYEARAVLLVESQSIPTDLVRSTVNSTALERLEIIKQNLRSRTTLLELDNRFGLTPADADLSPTERVAALRSSIYFQQRLLGDRRAGSITTSFTIAVRSENPRQPAVVANALTDCFSFIGYSPFVDRCNILPKFVVFVVGIIVVVLVAFEVDILRVTISKHTRRHQTASSASFAGVIS